MSSRSNAPRVKMEHARIIMSRILRKRNGIRYSCRMTNTAEQQQPVPMREIAAANLAAELARQRWSDRKAATALGVTHVYVSRRASGKVELTVSDLDMFARFLNVSVSRFFEKLPEKDSNLQPAGLETDEPESDAAFVTDIRTRVRKPNKSIEPRRPAILSMIGSR